MFINPLKLTPNNNSEHSNNENVFIYTWHKIYYLQRGNVYFQQVDVDGNNQECLAKEMGVRKV